MKMKFVVQTLLIAGLFAAFPMRSGAHCDTMDGPVVADAKRALETGDVVPVLKWVKEDREPEIRAAFAKTLAVRGQSAEARELADRYFFETLVRIHRAGEGEPYTGLKPADGPVEPGIAAADQAIASGNVESLLTDLSENEAASIRRQFQRVMETKKHAEESVEAGREYVKAYVEFIHHAEQGHDGERAEVEQTLQELEHEWADAVKRQDAKTIDRIQADDFEFIGPTGEVWTKARALDFIQGGNLEITSFELSEFKVRLFGDTAVVSFRVDWNGFSGGADISGPQRMTDVFVNRDGRWQCVTSQTTRIPEL